MDLQSFVAVTLKQLIGAVKEAQQFAKENNARVFPDNSGGKQAATGQTVESVEFDVAVTVTEGSEKKGGLGVVIAALTIGGTGQTSMSSSTISRLKFSIPVAWPLD